MTNLRQAAEMALEALDIIWATESDFFHYQDQIKSSVQALRQALAQPDEVLAEREACAEVCDGISDYYETRTDLNQTQKQVGQLAAEVCGVRIRERGEK